MKITPFLDPNRNALLLNVQYVPILYDDTSGKLKKIANDFLYLIYRDLDTKEKFLVQVESPSTDIFIVNEKFRGNFRTQRKYIEEEKLDRYNVPYAKIPAYIRNIIKESGVDQEYLKIAESAPKEVLKWRYCMFSDYGIKDYAMISYLINNESYLKTGILDNTSVTRAFLDIESDVYGLTTAQMDEGMGPINAVSVVVPYNKLGEKYDHPKVYTFLLRNYRRYKDQEYLETHLNDFLEKCHEEFDKKYHEPKFIIKFYDSEIDLLRHLFAMLHYESPDFVEIWNMPYDINKIMARLQTLGEDPNYYFCHSDFKRPITKYNFDRIYQNDFKNKNESFDCASYMQWIDQMTLYARIRKQSSDYGGNSLDNVAHIELDAEKRRYSNPKVSVLNGAILEYWNFVLYSINDTLLQFGIDEKTGDLDTLFDQSIYGGTTVDKTLKQSCFLKNVFAIEYFKMGIAPGNNLNIDYAKTKNEELATDIEAYNMMREDETEEEDYDDISLQGALVGDPTLNEKEGVELFGEKSDKFFSFMIDFDYKSEYPCAKITANIAPQTQVGRIIIPDKILDDENPDNNQKFMRAGKFIEDYESGDVVTLGRWFRLPTTYDLIKKYENIKNSDLELVDGYVTIHRKIKR